MKPLTQGKLDSMTCTNATCDHKDHTGLFLTQSCHPKAGVFAMYSREDGTLKITCRVCNKHVASVEVAP